MSKLFDTAWLHDWESRKLATGSRGRPVLDALLDPADMECPAGQEIQQLHVPIIKDLRRRGWVYDYSNPTKPTGATAGVPDFKVWAPAGIFFVVECKTASGKLSKAQKGFQDAICALGHKYHVVKSMAGWQRVIRGYFGP